MPYKGRGGIAGIWRSVTQSTVHLADDLRIAITGEVEKGGRFIVCLSHRFIHRPMTLFPLRVLVPAGIVSGEA